MKMFRTTLAGVALLLALTAAHAQTAVDDSLYQAFGGQAGVQRLMDDFVPRLVAEPRFAPFFEHTKVDDLKKQLTDQICAVAGGPCKYEGASMKKAHADFRIRKGDFNALVELLQVSMDRQGIPFRDQNRLLARLAPMHRDIVNTP